MTATVAAAGAGALPLGLTASSRTIGTFALSLATFMAVLDISIANVSIPAIAGDLGVSPNQGTWIITSFGVATAISLPLTGWLVRRFGTVRLFVASVLLFTLASLLCGLAPSMELLVLFRVLQGAVAGPMIPLCQALLLRSHPPERLGQALTTLAVTTLTAPIIGPLLGGWLTDNLSWRWVFHVNVPVGLVCAIVVARVFQPLETRTSKGRIDAVGLGMLIVWVGALQLMLDLGKDWDWLESSAIVWLGLTAIVFLALFLVWESTDDHPIVDLSLFRLRNFWIGAVVMALAYAIFLGNLVLLPLWLQQHMGYTATLAGFVLAPVGLLGVLAAPFVGRFVGRHDPRLMVTGSFVVFAGTLWMRSFFSTETDLQTMMVPSFIQGAGNAMFFVPLLAIILSQVPSERVAAASGVSNFLRYTAGAFGASLITTAWDWRASLHRSRLVEAIHDGAVPLLDARASLAAAGLGPEQQLALVERLVEEQAHTLAATDIFHASALMFVALLGLLWCARREGGN